MTTNHKDSHKSRRHQSVCHLLFHVSNQMCESLTAIFHSGTHEDFLWIAKLVKVYLHLAKANVNAIVSLIFVAAQCEHDA